MEDCYLVCNIPTCRKQIIEKAWVTRCFHVFCPEHGRLSFLVPSNQISCPVCDTVNSKEVDIVCCETSPHEMFLSGVSPERAIQLASMSVKLWSRQHQMEKNYYLSHLNTTVKKLNQFRTDSQKHYLDLKCKLEHQVSNLQKGYSEIVQKYNELKNELESTRLKLQKYQVGYNSLLESNIGQEGPSYPGEDTWTSLNWLEQHRDNDSAFCTANSNPPSRDFLFSGRHSF